ncbi:MAG: PTS transporter subunit EIIB [Actinomycetota bacterium]
MDLEATAAAVIAGLGGGDNIKSMEPCITRIRCELEDLAKLDEPALKKAGAFAVVRFGSGVQVVMGTLSDNIESAMRRQLGR